MTREDRLAETLLRRNDTDPAPLPTAEALVIALAYEYAGGNYIDLQTAYAGLRGALQAAAEMRAELDRLHNMDDRLTAVLRRVADLNDRGLRDEAGDALEAAIKANDAERDKLQDAALHQDRLCNRPDAAAAKLIARLKAQAPAGGVFAATQRLIVETRELGTRKGDPYDLSLALVLAKANHDRAKGAQVPAALCDLCDCYRVLGECLSENRHLYAARKCVVSALRLTSRQHAPQAWAVMQNSLGNVLHSLGYRTRDPALLKGAVAAFLAALTVHTHKDSPLDWAGAQNNFGIALHALVNCGGDPALLEKAIDAYRAALTVRTTEASSMGWAASHNNLGLALRALGDRDGDPTRLHEAIAAYRAALTIYIPELAPRDWAITQNNLGDALQSLGEREGDPARLHEAVAAYRAALTVRTVEAAPIDWAATQNNLGTALRSLGDREGDPARLHEAVGAFRAALTVYAVEAAPMDWATTQNNLGLALRWLGTLERAPDHFTAARDAYDACLTHRAPDAAPFLWAQTQWNLADLALAWHALDPQPARLDTAQAHLDAARAVFTEAENTHQIAECDRLQRLIDDARAASGEASPPPRGEG